MDFSVSTVTVRGYARCQGIRGKHVASAASSILFLFPTRSRSPVSVYYFRCVGIVPMPCKVVPGDESGAQILLADAMLSCSSADKLQALRTFHAALIV